ncbi:MAG TPA: twin-arginine translocase subunit TatC [Candidatus Methylomirabilis sp.]|nr:twin-arginine translocase subunit TatC [Candidatus Methylomirabilis sp.]
METGESKVMPLMEHLNELRIRLLRCIIALVIGMAIAWNFSGDLLTFVERPLTGHTYLQEAKGKVYQAMKQRFPRLYERYKLGEGLNPATKEDRRLNYSAPLEPFFVQIKISMIAGCMLALPVVFYQLWMFIAPGLTSKERKWVVPFVTAGTVSFCVGALFFLIVIWPVIINFSLSYESEGLRSWFNLTAYVNFCLRLITIFGLVFELPVVALILARFGLVSSRFLARQRKFAVLVSAIVAAFHADLVTMFVIWVPLYLMYEISIWVTRIFGRKARVEATAAA